MAGKTTVVKNKPTIHLHLADPNSTDISSLEKGEMGEEKTASPLLKSILNALRDHEDKVNRLAFEKDPTTNVEHANLYRPKTNLIPDNLLKRIAIQDDLVAAIVNARANQVSAFGRPQPDRFSTGFKIEIKPGVNDDATKQQKEEIQKRIKEVTDKLISCGEKKGWSDRDKLSFSQFLSISTRNALVCGRFATEIIYVQDATSSFEKKFHSFRPIDAGTIYRAAPYKEATEQVREEARKLLENIANKKLPKEPEKKDEEYTWVQVIEGRAVQAFTAEECVVHNCYPVSDVELQGYPLTPLDTVIAAVTTHINITTHNKLYFQNGRATRGMLVIKSEDVDEGVVKQIRQHFNAAINNVNNAWRMPVFQVGPQDEVSWQAIDSGQRDMEFQYLSDTNARVILSAFQMSPEELPGYAHLSRGTNNQALSESNNEYKLEAHRDVGIRPLLAQFQDFVNEVLFPLIDPNLSKLCVIKLQGLDADTAEKESIRIQQDAPLHMDYDEIREKVEKDPVGKEFGGKFPLNPQWQAIADKYLTVGFILEKFFGVANATKDPRWDYVRDPFYFQNIQLQMQQQQMQMQAQQAQAQAAQGGGQPGGDDGGGGDEGGGPPSKGGGDKGGGSDEKGGDKGVQRQDSPQPGNEQGAGQQDVLSSPSVGQDSDLSRGVDQLLGMIQKSEAQLPPSRRRLLAHQRRLVQVLMDDFEKDSMKAVNDIVDIADKHSKK